MTSMRIRFFSILSLSIPVSALALAQQTPQSLADAELPSLLTIYKDIHTRPELSGYEERTAALVAKELRAAGCQVTEHVGKYENSKLKGYGVVGVMKNGDGPTVLVRTDMDALPVEEDTGLPYASKVVAKNDEGKDVHVMHACGHDAHIAIFIGTARALAKLNNQRLANHHKPGKQSAGSNSCHRRFDPRRDKEQHHSGRSENAVDRAHLQTGDTRTRVGGYRSDCKRLCNGGWRTAGARSDRESQQRSILPRNLQQS